MDISFQRMSRLGLSKFTQSWGKMGGREWGKQEGTIRAGEQPGSGVSIGVQPAMWGGHSCYPQLTGRRRHVGWAQLLQLVARVACGGHEGLL